MTTTSDSFKPIKSAVKVCNIIDILTIENQLNGSGLSLSQLSEKSGIKPNTLFAILKTLIICGYLCQGDDGKYSLGEKCLRIGTFSSSEKRLFHDTILPKLGDISNRIGETVVFAILSGGKRHQLYSIEPDKPVRVVDTEYSDIYSLVTGLALLSAADKFEIEDIVRKNGYPEGVNNEKEFEKFREKFLANTVIRITKKSKEIETFGIGLRVFGITCCVGVFLPLYRCTPDIADLISNELLTFLKDITAV